MKVRAALAVAIAAMATAACTSTQNGTGEGQLTPSPHQSTATSPATPSPSPVSPRSTSSPGAPTSTTPKTGSSSTNAPPSQGNAPKGFKPMSVTFISPTDAWTLGYAGCTSARCTTILHSTDGTTTWRSIPAPRAAVDQPQRADPQDIAVLRFATAQDGWAAVGALYSTHDAGSSWQRQQLGGPRGQVVSLETGGGYVYAVVDGSKAVHVYASPIGSDDWRPVAKFAGASAQLVVSGTDWYLAADGGVWHGSGLSHATRRGASPCPEHKGYYGPYLAISDPDSLDAVCSGGAGMGSASYLVYGSNDGARSWRRNGAAQREMSGLWGLADNAHGVLLMAVASAASDILRSTDIGENLRSTHPTNISGGYEWTDLGFTTATQAVAVLGGKAMYLSSDAGQSWRRVHFR